MLLLLRRLRPLLGRLWLRGVLLLLLLLVLRLLILRILLVLLVLLLGLRLLRLLRLLLSFLLLLLNLRHLVLRLLRSLLGRLSTTVALRLHPRRRYCARPRSSSGRRCRSLQLLRIRATGLHASRSLTPTLLPLRATALCSVSP